MITTINKQNKKAALELSISTVVVLVIGMSMLILGIVLVKNIFNLGSSSIELVDNNVKAQINKLFNEEDKKTIIYLPDNQGNIKKGKQYNVRFGIKNTVRAEASAGQFTYSVSATEVESGCPLTLAQADEYIKLGKTGGPLTVQSGGEPTERIIVVEAPDTAPLCSTTYDIVVKKDNQDYDTNFFIINVEG